METLKVGKTLSIETSGSTHTYAFPSETPCKRGSIEMIRDAIMVIWQDKPETAWRVIQRIRKVINFCSKKICKRI